MNRVKVWDLPTRLFHWVQLLLLLGLLFSGYQGGEYLRLHALCGETLLVLLLFRLFWACVGSQTARFSEFVRGPVQVFRYLNGQGSGGGVPGHNPLGGWMVLLLLLVVLLQILSGLCASDLDSYIHDGPLAHHLSALWSERLTWLHLMNVRVILALSLLHVGAIAVYRLCKKQRLLRAMLTGYQDFDAQLDTPAFAPLSRALLCVLLATLLVLALLYLAA
jgi:cytochrome b